MGNLAGTDLERNRQINRTLGKRISQSKELVKGLQEQAELAEKIAGDFGVRTFRGAAGIAEAFGFRDLAPELDKAAAASAEQALVNMGNKDARARFLKMGDAGDFNLKTGKGITKEIAESLKYIPLGSSNQVAVLCPVSVGFDLG